MDIAITKDRQTLIESFMNRVYDYGVGVASPMGSVECQQVLRVDVVAARAELEAYIEKLEARCKEDVDKMQKAFDKLYMEKCQVMADHDEQALAYQNTLRTWHNTIRLLAESQEAFDAVRHILDEHICTWRENKKLSDRRLVQRGIDAYALQQFRMRAFGSLLPNDDGVYQVSDLNGKIYAEAPTSAEAEKAFADLNKKYKVVDGQLFEV